MFSKLKETFRRFPTQFLNTVKRFSGSVALLLILYILTEIDVHSLFSLPEEWFVFLPLGAIALLAADVAFGGHPLNWWVEWCIKSGLLILLGLTCFTLFDYDMRPAFLLVATVALFGIACCLAYRDNAAALLGVLIVRAAAALLFACVLFAGLALIVAGTDLLLFSVDTEVYGAIVRFSFILFAPLMFLYGIPAPGEGKTLLKGYRQLLRIVILPLLAVFMLVLYCYYIKLAVTASLPIGELGGVSLIFLCLTLPMVILAKPFCENWFAKLRIALLYGTFPVFAALFFTAFRQISLYGVSITRYLVVAGGLALLICTVLLIVKGGKHLTVVFAVLMATALLCTYGPQSCYNLSRSSQHSRLVSLLEQEQMILQGAVCANPDAVAKEEILDIIDYCNREGLDLPDCFPIPYRYDDIEQLLGFGWESVRGEASAKWYNYPAETPVDLGDGRYLLNGPGNYLFDTPQGQIKVYMDEHLSIFRDDVLLYDASHQEMMESVLAKVSLSEEGESFIYRFENDAVSGVIPFDYISENTDEIYGGWSLLTLTLK